MKEVSESLAGRVAYHDLGPLTVDETGVPEWRRLWLRGGFPRSYLADDDTESALWRDDFMRSHLERDIPALGILVPAETLRRFWVMVSHYHGQVLNLSELGRSFGVSDHTVRRYLEILSGTYMIRLVPAWYANIGKRLVKAPKLYVRDSGLLHSLHTIATPRQLESHPKLGASWEGFAMEQAIRLMDVSRPHFWRTHTGAELDLVWQARGALWGMEFKYQDAPAMTRSMHAVLRDLPVRHLWIVYIPATRVIGSTRRSPCCPSPEFPTSRPTFARTREPALRTPECRGIGRKRTRERDAVPNGRQGVAGSMRAVTSPAVGFRSGFPGLTTWR